MKKVFIGLLFFFEILVINLSAAGIETSLDKLKVVINEINEDVPDFVELYSANGIDVVNWKLVLNDPGTGTVAQCVFSNNFTAGSYFVLDSSNCAAMAFHQNKNEVFLLDSSDKVVHYVSIWKPGGQGTQSYLDYYDNKDSSVTTDLNNIENGNIDYCAIIDGSTGLPQWSNTCVPSAGGTNQTTLSINDISIAESNSGIVNAVFTISLSKAATSTITVDYATVDGSAFMGSDYQTANGTLTFTSGQTSKTITVKIFGDKTYESDETFTVVLSNPNGAALDKSIGNGLIVNDDAVIPGLKCYRTDFNQTAVITNDWTVSRSSGSFTPSIVSGRLQVTQAGTKQSTMAMLKKFFPPAKNRYITVEFDAFAYNGTGADGMAVVLSDASVTPVAGAFGGSLGYAQKCQNGVAGCSSDCTVSGGCPGFSGGWLGVGFDEYSNFSNGSEGRYNASGSGGSLAKAVAIRGSDGNTSNKSSLYNYKYLYGTAANAYTSGAKYRVIIDAFESHNTIVSVDVNKNDGNGFISLINGFDINTKNDANWVQKAIPDYFRLSVTGSTGSLTNIHELDNLEVCSVMYEEDESDIYINEFSATPMTVSSTSDIVSFTLKIFNPGPVDTSDNVVVSISGLSQWDIVSSSASVGSFSGGVWTIGAPFAKGTSATLSFSAKMTALSTKTLTASVGYAKDPDLSNNTKSITITVPTSYQAVEKDGTSVSKLFTKVSGVSFNADILTSLPGDIATLRLYGDGALLLDLNATPPAAISSMSDRLRLTGITVSKAAKVAQFEINGTQVLDSFAIKPSDFTLTPSIATIKAGGSFDLSAANPTSGYNGIAAITTATYNQSCATKSGFLTTEPVSLNFASTPQSATGLIAKDVGDINVSIKDSTWTAVDQYADCLEGNNSNIVDANGRVGCDVETNATIKVVPYDINASKTAVDPMWSYKSTNGAPKFSLSFDVNATRPPLSALGETQPQLLGNFSSGCFAKSSSIDIVMGLNLSGKSLTNIQDVNATTAYSGVTITPSATKLTVLAPATLFSGGKASVTLNINSEKNIATAEVPFVLSATKWTTTADGTIYSDLITSNPIYFLYGKIAAPNTMTDYVPTLNARAYAQVYATDQSKLPNSGVGFVRAPGSSSWWINKNHDAASGSIASAVIRTSDKLLTDVTSNAIDFGFSSPSPYSLTGGIAPFGVTMTSDQNKDQQIKIHFGVPAYLWYGSNAYSFAVGSDCTQHPCMAIDIFGTQTDATWYGSGTKDDKTIKSVPKGKRAPKVNW